MDALSVRSGIPNVIASKVLALEKTKDGQVRHGGETYYVIMIN